MYHSNAINFSLIFIWKNQQIRRIQKKSLANNIFKILFLFNAKFVEF